jgi:tRNA (uracil-5-)-methyltransferase
MDETNYVMYEKQPDESKPQRVKIQQYPVASKLINSMMPVVLQHVCAHEVLRRKLFQVNYHTTLSGHAMVTMIYHKKLLECQEDWKKMALQLRYAMAGCM